MASSILGFDTAISIPGGTFNNPIGICRSVATTAGSTLITHVMSAYDTSAQTFSVNDTLGNTWTQLQYLSKSGGWNTAMHVQQNAPSYPAPIAITFTGTVSGGAASATLTPAWGGTTATYIIRFSTGETRASALTNGSASCTWSQGLGGAATASATAGYGPYFSQSGGNGDFTAVVMTEIGGVVSSGGLVSNALINSGITNGSNNINCGSLACGSATGMILMYVNNVGNGAGSPTFTPIVGTSPVNFTQSGSPYFAFNSSPALEITQYANGTNFGTVTPTAGTQETASDDYYVFGVFLTDSGGGSSTANVAWYHI